MKGSILDLIMIIPIIFAIGIAVIFGHYILNEFDQGYDQERPETFNQTMTRGMSAIQNFDYAVVFVGVFLSIIVIMLSFFVNSHPIFFGFAMLSLTVFVILSTIFSNVFGEIMAQSMLVPTANQFPTLMMFMENLPKVTLLLGAVIAIAMYAKGEKKPI